MSYDTIRHFADSWALLVLFTVFLGVILFVYRPGARAMQDDAARSIFRNESRPAPREIEKESR